MRDYKLLTEAIYNRGGLEEVKKGEAMKEPNFIKKEELEKEFKFIGDEINFTLKNDELTEMLGYGFQEHDALSHMTSILGEHCWVLLGDTKLLYRNEDGHIIMQQMRRKTSCEVRNGL